MLTGDLELIDSLNGHFDVVYGTYDPRHLTRWNSKRDVVFSRQWFRGQDGTYTILQFPIVHKKCPAKLGYRRTEINPSTWEIRNLNTSFGSNGAKCLVTQMLEIHSAGWCRWKQNKWAKFEKTVPYALLSQLAGLKEYIGANPSLRSESSTQFVHSTLSNVSSSSSEYKDAEAADEFYDAIASDLSSDDEDSDNEEIDSKDKKVKLKNISWTIASLALKRTSAPDLSEELDPNVPAIILDPSQYCGSMRQEKDEADSNCWTSPRGNGRRPASKAHSS
ncbi:Protein ENHANCED DISEASE RESISTANCE like [Actinidia chinensis var. chinensis]|uniref:Protein ENHANCED DISEASE RESISTANCE like n=1 Tax=Actinidia chinensis var. chinensis TaxID=1590841 RepID=A0A2R6QHR7_ACTCC|nr:Protein ENHANCED DISEASE RESISTANCE like [Actinidia chinensis var. chinensis]